ncbi:hypothetical protein NQZ79_g83 [Umbelopsis isabellina]|nr:hypothetical protein NQZ79_g83 [Umbelopsis isabellina]
MSNDNDSSKTTLEEDLVVDVGKGTDLIGVSELQSNVLPNQPDEYPPMSEASEKGVNPVTNDAMVDQAKESESSSKSFEAGVPKRKKQWWRGRSSNMDANPRMFSKKKKISIISVIALAASISPISSTIYYPALVTVQEALNTTETAINASLDPYTIPGKSHGAIPNVLTEIESIILAFDVGKFWRYLCIGCALSVNVTMLIVFRAFSAIGSSSVMSLGAGTISDIYEPHQRGRAFSLYTCGPLLGPALGPVIGGYLNQGLGWRSIFWFLVIFSFCLLCGIFFLLPETFRPAPAAQVLPIANEASEKQDTTTVENTSEQKPAPRRRRRYVNPLSALELLKFPNIQLVVVFVAFMFMFFYIINTTFTRTYTLQYGLSSGIVGICYFPQAIGAMTGGVFGGRYSDNMYRRRVEKEGESWPELRLGGWLMWTSIALQGAAFVAYGWCVQKNVHFAWGLVCQFILIPNPQCYILVGFTLMIPNVAITAYIVDCFKSRGASATACNNFTRYICAGVGSLLASVLDNALGDGILYTICGGLLVLSSSTLFVIIKKGKSWGKLREGF